MATALNNWSSDVLGPFSANGWSEELDRGVGPFTSNRSLDLHCDAIATAIGLQAIRGNIDPMSQEGVVEWEVHRLIVASDVGEENVGRARSPWPNAEMHVLWQPGSFEGGLSSEQQRLVRRYEGKQAARDKLVLLLISLNVISPRFGIEKALFKRESLGGDLIGSVRVGTESPEQPITEWEEGFVITDAVAALADMPQSMVERLTSAIENVDPFWPGFSSRHRLIW